jgi:spermidine dehydrogenase
LSSGAALLPRAILGAGNAGPDPTADEYFLSRGISPADPQYYPPALTGMRGSHPGAFEAAHALRDGALREDIDASATDEHYDLIVVGGGISGLAAAYFFRQQNGPQSRILVLDNHDDFGGHAKRNEFSIDGRTLLCYGGTQSIEGYSFYSPVARGLLAELAIQPERFNRYFDTGFRKQWGLVDGCFFDRETFGVDKLVRGHVGYDFNDHVIDRPRMEAFVARAPWADVARLDMLRLHFGGLDYLKGKTQAERAAVLNKVSLKSFLADYAHVHPDLLRYYQRWTHSSRGAGIDAISAAEGLVFISAKVAREQGMPANTMADVFMNEPYIYHFPDGNASIARLLVRSLVTGAAPGNSMEDIVTARMNYAALDRADLPVRIRLNSTAVRVKQLAAAPARAGVEVTYVVRDKVYRVRSDHAVLACWNMIIPHLCPELPVQQKQALSSCVKVPLVYANVLIRNWRSLHKLGVATAYAPGSYFNDVRMDFPVSMGGYAYTKAPNEPCVIHMQHVPCAPGLPLREQHRAGRAEIYATRFEDFEQHITAQLQRMLGPGGFRASRDIAAITVNRWPHGYTYGPSSLWDPDTAAEDAPPVIGRKPFGPITIANSDSGGVAETPVAIDQAHRAIQEIMKMKRMRAG